MFECVRVCVCIVRSIAFESVGVCVCMCVYVYVCAYLHTLSRAIRCVHTHTHHIPKNTRTKCTKRWRRRRRLTTGSGAPVEANSLLRHVLLLPSVSWKEKKKENTLNAIVHGARSIHGYTWHTRQFFFWPPLVCSTQT